MPFCAVAVVARDVDDQLAVELTRSLDLVDHSADLVVGIGKVRGEHVHLADKLFVLVGRDSQRKSSGDAASPPARGSSAIFAHVQPGLTASRLVSMHDRYNPSGFR
jgi:hypothetical protein